MDFNGPLTGGRPPRGAAGESGRLARSAGGGVCARPRSAAGIEYRSKRRSTETCASSASRVWIPAPAAATHVTPPAPSARSRSSACRNTRAAYASPSSAAAALAYENAMLDQAKAAGHALSVPTDELSGAVERMLGERDRLRAQNDALGMHFRSAGAAGGKKRDPRRGLRRAACRARAQKPPVSSPSARRRRSCSFPARRAGASRCPPKRKTCAR